MIIPKTVENLLPYTPGEQPKTFDWIKLNTNENPYPPSPNVAKAIINELGDGSNLRLYPDPSSSKLRKLLADKYNLKDSEVIIGNGSDDILNLLFRTFTSSQDLFALALDPSYSLYPVLADMQGTKIEYLDFDLTQNKTDFLSKVSSSKANIFFLTNPNAPLGVSLSLELIEEILKAFNGLVVVDEAYSAFCDFSASSLVSKYDNLIVCMTTSKSYSLAGLRVGWGLSSEKVINYLDRLRDSYNLDRLAQAGAYAALSDDDYHAKIVSKIKKTREYLSQNLLALNWQIYPSSSNFVFAKPVKNGLSCKEITMECFEYLKQNKILVRYFPNNPNTNLFLRITIATDSDMEIFLEKIKKWSIS